MTRPFVAVRRLLAGLVVAIFATFALIGAAEAHRLKMFVTVESGEIVGYAFFVGGGRPEGVDFVVRDGAGGEVHRGKTDDQGNFRWRPTAAADHSITVDAGDGHWIEGQISAERLGAAAAVPPPAGAAAVPTASDPAHSAPSAPTTACAAPIDPAALAGMVAIRVDEAVARQLRPLIEAQTLAEGRVRFNDVMGGIGMIVGLAGMGLWATSRRRRSGGEG